MIAFFIFLHILIAVGSAMAVVKSTLGWRKRYYQLDTEYTTTMINYRRVQEDFHGYQMRQMNRAAPRAQYIDDTYL